MAPSSALLGPLSDSSAALIGLLISVVDDSEALLDGKSPEFLSLVWLSKNVLLDSYSDERKIQRWVLGTLYFSLDGDRWGNKSRWMTDWDECRWWSRARQHPVCDVNGSYVSLDIGYNDAFGTIPTVLGLLTDLERINLQGGPKRFISGTIPVQLGRLSNMKEITLKQNELEGNIPSQIGRWNQLMMLDLSNNNLDGRFPFQFGFLRTLTTMDVRHNSLTGPIPTQIGMQLRLTKLMMSNNQFSGAVPSEIGKLTELLDINLERNKLASFPSEIGLLTDLQTLMMFTNGLMGTLHSEIGRLTNMSKLLFCFVFGYSIS